MVGCLINSLRPGSCIHTALTYLKLIVLTECICVFHFNTNNEVFPIQHYPCDRCSGKSVCFVCCMNLTFTCYVGKSHYLKR
jgi:hypothetical protein